ncbi:hypothetical protein [Amygdalobacter nucleatus]|uniref:hypothetical protein n=1 Tax=Amygdalobacter nucleatus TaxID=3029274 RepID=UPI0027A85109|nr:hypothetical protein [Amygdalobacter nucleatus]WEG36809.1 hypothetical protein PYS63_06665 [Amygdalobacter nucleatus]
MKKIVTLALAAVMTLGLTVLPKADYKEDLKKVEDKLAEMKSKHAEEEKVKKDIKEKEAEIKKQEVKVEKAETAVKEAQNEYDAAEEDKKSDKQGAVDKAKKELKEETAKLAEMNFQLKYLKAQLNPVVEKTTVDEYEPGCGYVYMKVADGKDVSGFVKAGAYTVNSLIKHFGLEHVVLADDQAPLVEVKELKVTTIKVAVVQQYPIKVRAISEDGTELGEYEVNAGLYATRGWVTAEKVAAKALTFKNGVALVDDVDGYWVLADVEANKTPQYFHKTTEGGNRVITAVYTVAKHKVWQGKDGKTTTKPGQVGKTGEVATVATGIGALMTLAGVVVATKRH